MAETTEACKKEAGFKEEAGFRFSFFKSQLKENIVDAAGIGWIFENESIKKVCDFFATVVILYVRLGVKIAIFLGITYLVIWVLFPHS